MYLSKFKASGLVMVCKWYSTNLTPTEQTNPEGVLGDKVPRVLKC